MCSLVPDPVPVHKQATKTTSRVATCYKTGLAGIDAVSRKRFEKPFVGLSAEQQDEVLLAVESGNDGQGEDHDGVGKEV